MSEVSYVLSRHPYTEFQSSENHDHEISSDSCFFIFLVIAQDMQVKSLPMTHQRALLEFGRVATASAPQTFVNPQYSLAFKSCPNLATMPSQMVAYGIQPIRNHSRKVRLEGVRWAVPEISGVIPNLIFVKCFHGGCMTFIRSREDIYPFLFVCFLAFIGEDQWARYVSFSIRRRRL